MHLMAMPLFMQGSLLENLCEIIYKEISSEGGLFQTCIKYSNGILEYYGHHTISTGYDIKFDIPFKDKKYSFSGNVTVSNTGGSGVSLTVNYPASTPNSCHMSTNGSPSFTYYIKGLWK